MGTIVFDRPRHAVDMHLPLDYPRINQFPGVVHSSTNARSYEIIGVGAGDGCRSRGQRDLIGGLGVSLNPGRGDSVGCS